MFSKLVFIVEYNYFPRMVQFIETIDQGCVGSKKNLVTIFSKWSNSARKLLTIFWVQTFLIEASGVLRVVWAFASLFYAATDRKLLSSKGQGPLLTCSGQLKSKAH